MTYSSYNTFTPEDDSQDSPHGPRITKTGGTAVMSVDANGTPTVKTLGVSSISTNGFADDGTWQSTARTPSGSPAKALTPSTIVTIQGQEGRISDFIHMGLLRPSGAGSYELVEGGQEGAQGNPGDDPAHPDHARIPDELVEAENAALEPFNQGTLDTGLPLTIDALSKGGDLQKVVSMMATRAGIASAEAQQRLDAVVSIYEAQTAHYLQKQGITPSDLQGFYDWAIEGQQKGLKEAMESQLYAKDLSPWKSLVAKYMSQTAPSAAALQRNGFEVKGDLVRINSDWMPIRAAARSGLI